jgi:hypothetical protein
LSLSYDETGEYFFIDMKERGGDEKRIREEVEKLGEVEFVQFSPCSADQLLKLG